MDSNITRKTLRMGTKIALLAVFGLGLAFNTAMVNADKGGEHSNGGDHSEHSSRNGQVMWLNHLALQSADTAILTATSNSAASGAFPGLSGLLIQPVAVGASSVQMALDLPKDTKIVGVRVCYGNTGLTSFISQISLGQVTNPAAPDTVITDTTALTSATPVCVNSKSIRPVLRSRDGAIILSLGITADPTSKVLIRGLGVLVK
ncbi:hypothetical protein MGMO_52c00150 [Methyloglobulus morosus KoM1]|uniref:Uncharacterized protein n=1 Tax=Methyloglobulus morosus KoM1 TaxID=1116472 RepID=V5DZE0_9GAMM|nr:hypothetical protein [Methyloglobulus morosus]ESS72661.1 hypothetical protein MGMO_52c00150 [Methyloglobulus morosus KoM1]